MLLRDLFENKKHFNSKEFQQWFSGSKIVNDDGSPKVLYHGTRQDHFDTFLSSKGGEFGPGIYLTSDPGTADFYASNVASGEHGPNIAPVYLNMKNPFFVLKTKWIQMTQNRTPRSVQNSLKKKGYDGIVGIGINGIDKQYVAFDGKQIKSATANSGSYGENDLIREGMSRALLYRGVRDVAHFYQDLVSDEMKGYSKQRIWKDGRRRVDHEPDYEGSLWMSGICLTRDVEYAKRWGSITLVFDQDKIRQNYKIIPYHWGYSVKGNPSPKREREEFVVLSSFQSDYKADNEDFGFDDDKFRLDHREFQKPQGALKPLSKYLIGFFVENDGFYRHTDELEFILNHPKCLGRYDVERKRR